MKILCVLIVNNSSNLTKQKKGRNVLGRIVPRFLPVWAETSLAQNVLIPTGVCNHRRLVTRGQTKYTEVTRVVGEGDISRLRGGGGTASDFILESENL